MAHFSAESDGSESSGESDDDSARGTEPDVPTPWWMVPANGVGRRVPDGTGQGSAGQGSAAPESSIPGSTEKQIYDVSQPPVSQPPVSQPPDRAASQVPPLWTDLPGGVSPYVDLDREAWAELAESTPMPLTEEELARLAGLGDPIDLDEVATVYLPLSRLLNLFAAGTGMLHTVTSTFLRERSGRTPFVIGVAGSVAVGKSTSARVLRELLARWPDTPRVELVTTDGFLYPNAVLEERKIMHRKGFPESYDRRGLLQFMAEVKSGAPEVSAPKYDHLTYDILENEQITVHKPDVLIVEGLNVLQPARIEEGRVDSDGSSALAVSDFFDFSIYVDAEPADVENWFVKRFLHLRETAFADPDSFFHQFSSLTDVQAVSMATGVWRTINEPNLIENILPTRGRANLVLTKGPDHAVTNVRLRKL